MLMFMQQSLPDAVIIKPDMENMAVSGECDLMREPIIGRTAIDYKAFMDLRGTERLHGGAPALSLMN